MDQSFRRERIVPDLITLSPRHLLQLQFPTGQRAQLGNVIFPIQTREPPAHMQWPLANETALYTLIMTDPAPGGAGEWIHWLVTNIQANDAARGDTLVEYVPAAPPPATGLHRYTLLVYQQSARFTDARLAYVSNRTVRGRGQFSTRIFAEQNRLGAPWAGNFFMVCAGCDWQSVAVRVRPVRLAGVRAAGPAEPGTVLVHFISIVITISITLCVINELPPDVSTSGRCSFIGVVCTVRPRVSGAEVDSVGAITIRPPIGSGFASIGWVVVVWVVVG